jgi:fructose-specific component phosphotransferase system IIB-like protein
MAYSKQKMSIDTRSCTRKFSQPVDSNAENELVCVCGSQTQDKETRDGDQVEKVDCGRAVGDGKIQIPPDLVVKF